MRYISQNASLNLLSPVGELVHVFRGGVLDLGSGTINPADLAILYPNEVADLDKRGRNRDFFEAPIIPAPDDLLPMKWYDVIAGEVIVNNVIYGAGDRFFTGPGGIGSPVAAGGTLDAETTYYVITGSVIYDGREYFEGETFTTPALDVPDLEGSGLVADVAGDVPFTGGSVALSIPEAYYRPTDVAKRAEWWKINNTIKGDEGTWRNWKVSAPGSDHVK